MTAIRMFTLAFLACVLPQLALAQANCVQPDNSGELRATIGASLNSLRQSQSLADLRPNNSLAQAATVHACDMALNNFFGHRGTDGSNSEVRLRRQGYHDCLTAENLAWGYNDPSQIMTGWWNSPGHRQNMLLQNVRDYGVGVVDGPQGRIWVLVIARPC